MWSSGSTISLRGWRSAVRFPMPASSVYFATSMMEFGSEFNGTTSEGSEVGSQSRVIK